MIGYIYLIGAALAFIPCWRATMRFFISDIGLDEGFDVYMTWILGCLFGFVGALCWPIIAPFLIGKHFFHGNAAEFTRSFAGQSREEKLKDRERRIREREWELARLEREALKPGVIPVEPYDV